MSDFVNSNFQLLPKEIIIKILAKIDTFSLINFCKAYNECSYAYTAKSVVRTLTFYKTYSLTATHLQSISELLTVKHVVVLNLNCVTWVDAPVLREFMSTMVELQELYAIDTGLGFVLRDFATYIKLVKLRKLALTAHEKYIDPGLPNLPHIKALYIYYEPENCHSAHELVWLRKFPGLNHFWLNCECICSSISDPYPTIYFRRGALEVNDLSAQQLLFCNTIQMNYCNSSLCYFRETCFESCTPNVMYRNIGELFSKDETNGQFWQTLFQLTQRLPFGPRDAIKLRCNEETLQTHLFEELKFHNLANKRECNEICKNAFRKILKSPNVRHLKGLAFMTCLLYLEDESSGNSRSRRRRRQARRTNSTDAFAEIAENISNLETLEIFHCRREPEPDEIEIFAHIAKFKHLKYLSLQIPKLVNGEFLYEVLKSCKSLEVLKIECLRESETFDKNLAGALSEATALKDFRFESYIINTDIILDALVKTVPTRKLERIALICESLQLGSLTLLDKVLEKNDQLKFFYLGVELATREMFGLIIRVIGPYTHDHPNKNFIMFPNKKRHPMRHPFIADVHFREMILKTPTVAGMRDYEEVLIF